MTDKIWPCEHIWKQEHEVGWWKHEWNPVLVEHNWVVCPICEARRPEWRLINVISSIERGAKMDVRVNIILDYFEKMLPDKRDCAVLSGGGDLAWNECLEELHRRIEEERK